MWDHLDLLCTDVSEVCIASIFRVEATCSRWFLAHGFFYPEYGGDMFLWNVSSHKSYTAPHPRRQHSSALLLLRVGRCLATAVVSLFHDHCLAMGLYATIFFYKFCCLSNFNSLTAYSFLSRINLTFLWHAVFTDDALIHKLQWDNCYVSIGENEKTQRLFILQLAINWRDF
jgi:hypothetical protein